MQHCTFLGQVDRGQRDLNLKNLLRLAEALGRDPAELVQDLKPADSPSG